MVLIEYLENVRKKKKERNHTLSFLEQIKSWDSFLLLEEGKITRRDISCGFYSMVLEKKNKDTLLNISSTHKTLVEKLIQFHLMDLKQ